MSIRKLEHVRSALGRLNTRGCKVGAIGILFVLMATATAAVFSMDYATATATAHTGDVQLQAGADCQTDGFAPSQYPAATADISSTNDYAKIGISMFPSVTQAGTQANPQPATYYTDLLHVVNTGTADHTINQIVVSDISDQNGTLGEISIYCWKAVPDTTVGPLTNLPSYLGVNHVNITRSGNSVQLTPVNGALELNQPITHADTYYIGIVAHAASGAGTNAATNAGHVSFTVSVQWV